MQSKKPNKASESIVSEIENMRSGLIKQDLWHELTSYLFNEKDTQYLIDTMPEGDLVFSKFIFLLIQFQIKETEKILKGLQSYFTNLDKEKLGIMDVEQMEIILENTELPDWKERLTVLKKLIDPHSLGTVSFSVLAERLMEEVVEIESNGEKITVRLIELV